MLVLLLAMAPGAASGTDKALKVVIHNNEPSADHEKALGNVQHLLEGADGDVDIVVVSHGDGLSLVVADRTTQSKEVRSLLDRGVRFVACENTMEKMEIEPSRLLSGVSTVRSGAVEIARKQMEGYSYFKP